MIILKSKLLNKKSIPPACEYCTRGSGAPDGKTVLCPKKGVMQKVPRSATTRSSASRSSQSSCRSSMRAILSFNQAVFCSPLIDLTAGIM